MSPCALLFFIHRPLWFVCIMGLKNIVSHNASILSSFQSYNAPICNILIYHIAFGYDFHQFSINLWPDSVTKGHKIGPSDCIQMSKTSELPGAPWTPTRGIAPGPHQGPAVGPLDPTPIYPVLLTFHNCSSPPLQKTFQGPRAKHSSSWTIFFDMIPKGVHPSPYHFLSFSKCVYPKVHY